MARIRQLGVYCVIHSCKNDEVNGDYTINSSEKYIFATKIHL